MKTEWEKRRKDHLDYCSVGNGNVTIGSNDGTIESDSASVVTFEDFLKGRFQDLIALYFGPTVLAEVIFAVKSLQAMPPHSTF